jgi:hypothetical protein
VKKRYVYALLFLVPGFFASTLVAAVLFGGVFGVLWLFVFGDSTWPAWAEQVTPVVILVVFFCLWIGATVTGYVVGKRLESAPGLNARHVWMSLGATLLPIIMMSLHQLSIGNLGPKSDAQLCSEYCSDLGFATSSIPPRNSGERTCRCLGQYGEMEVSAPINELSR